MQGVKKKAALQARHHKNTVLSLLDRETGKVRTFHVANARPMKTLRTIVRDNVASEEHLMTDASNLYTSVGAEFRSHDTVKHTLERIRANKATLITTNTVESYFSVFKRGMLGTYQHCSEKHLHRYLAEFDFRHNNRAALGVNDGERANELAKGIVGKRLTYRRPNRKDVQA